jgi:hypothetical protein
MFQDTKRAESGSINLSAALPTWEAVMQAEDSSQPSNWDGYKVGPTASPVGTLHLPGGDPRTVCERYVSRQRLADMMGMSVRSIDRMVADGMPSENWGMRTRRFLPSAALRWAQQRSAVIA